MKIESPFDPTDAGTVWDGLSLNTERTSRSDDQAPNSEDYDRVVAEVISAETTVVDHEDRLATLEGADIGAGDAGSGVTAEEASGSGSAFVHQTTITLAGVALTTTDDATHGAFTSQELYDFPVGNIAILGAVASLALAAGAGGLADNAAIVAGVGTSAAAQSSGDGTLATAENNIIPSTAYTLSGGTKAATPAVSTAVKVADGHSSAAKAYLNFQCPTAGSSATDTLTVTGTVTITWVQLGDV